MRCFIVGGTAGSPLPPPSSESLIPDPFIRNPALLDLQTPLLSSSPPLSSVLCGSSSEIDSPDIIMYILDYEKNSIYF
jgi:hypothetical protein